MDNIKIKTYINFIKSYTLAGYEGHKKYNCLNDCNMTFKDYVINNGINTLIDLAINAYIEEYKDVDVKLFVKAFNKWIEDNLPNC